ACKSARNDLTRRCGALHYIQELLLHLLQLLRGFHGPWNSFKFLQVLRGFWRLSQGYYEYRLYPCIIAPTFTQLLHQLHYTSRTGIVSVAVVGVWQCRHVSHQSDWGQNSSRLCGTGAA
ncbi:hypothetical protein LTR60_007555, partial [Cryomyces antarcticus]